MAEEAYYSYKRAARDRKRRGCIRGYVEVLIGCRDLREERLLIRRAVEAKYGHGVWDAAKGMLTGRDF